MKIGILTFHFSKNSGGALQAYALRKFLHGLGHDVSFVNYQPAYLEDGASVRLGLSKKVLKANLKTMFLKAMSVRESIVVPKGSRDRHSNFGESFLETSGESLYSKEDVEKAAGAYDLLICGSDQIWNPSDQYGVDPVYYLDLEAKAKKISYAASFGSGGLEPRFSAEVSKLISGLDSVSVREEKGAELVERMTGMKVSCVPDPTLLLSEFTQLIAHGEAGGLVPQDTGLFCYVLRDGSGFQHAASQIAESLGCDVTSFFNPHRRWPSIGRELYGGPSDWLCGLSRSKAVLTNSFHGTVFSILLNKPFLSCALPGKRKGLSERVINLLEKVGLEDRLIDLDGSLCVKEKMEREIDWGRVNAKVNELREAGQSFLMNELS